MHNSELSWASLKTYAYSFLNSLVIAITMPTCQQAEICMFSVWRPLPWNFYFHIQGTWLLFPLMICLSRKYKPSHNMTSVCAQDEKYVILYLLPIRLPSLIIKLLWRQTLHVWPRKCGKRGILLPTCIQAEIATNAVLRPSSWIQHDRLQYAVCQPVRTVET